MADGKRQSSGKVATPKVAAQPQEPNDRDASISKAIGGRIRVTTSTNQTLEGTLYTACPITNVIALNTTPPPPNPSSNIAAQPGDYHIIPVSQVQSLTILHLPGEPDRLDGPGFQGALPSTYKVDTEALNARVDAAVKKLKEKEATRNKGASKEGQEIFDQMARTLPTRWHENNIVVNDNVMIKPPYRLEDCAANKDHQHSLQHVKKILEAYYAKKKVPQGGTSAARPGVATPIPPRKGG
ncbi:hypothetical protein NA57DRAFT_73360 [Rhizodiscina lignyota]|uniref:AD domain-containing protein n=1 Tax=Rhizodiscina lignyota TaxID=1504668 RepID=A0A9P4M8R4_9PEZI|nr:hypothetical protein NA57DRAFT_73360 [Rhizodiscina lignyota]